MSRAESRLIDTMIEVSILGIRERPSLSKSLKRSKPMEDIKNDSFGSVFESYFIHGSKVIEVDKRDYKDLGEFI